MLKTEMRNPDTMHLDEMSPLEIARVMNAESRRAVDAVEAVLEPVGQAIEAVTASLAAGGRLFYLGAGTSGRLGVLDASECPPTFGVPEELVVGIIAGGDRALRHASENAEDDPDAGVRELQTRGLTAKDAVVGISAAGGAAYVVRAVEYARSLGCVTVGITSNSGTALEKAAEIPICPDTGPEVLTGSTRLKAGTAQKLILNMLSTGVMIRSGFVCENLMINLRPTNEKLRGRVIRITRELTGLSEPETVRLLEENEWVIRRAVDAAKR